MAYSGRAQQAFHSALLKAYPTKASLEQFAFYALDVSLENVTRLTGNLDDVVFDLIRWAEREGRLADLIEKAYDDSRDNPYLREAVRHIRDPELVESRWFARFVPMITWLMGVLNVGLILVVVRLYLIDPIDMAPLAGGITLVAFLAYLVWLLLSQLTGGPARTGSVIWLFRRLIAHSRLVRRDWLTLLAMCAAIIVLTASIEGSPNSVSVTSHEAALSDSSGVPLTFPLEVGWTPQCLPAPQSESDLKYFRCGYYRVGLCVRAFNPFNVLTVQIKLLTYGVAFLTVLPDQAFKGLESQKQNAEDGSLRYSVGGVGRGRLAGCRQIVFTLQHRNDQFVPREVTIYAAILRGNDEDPPKIRDDRQTFSFKDWSPR